MCFCRYQDLHKAYGIVTIVISVILMIFEIIGFIFQDAYVKYGTGLWSGALCLSPGILNVLAGCRDSMSNLVVAMSMESFDTLVCSGGILTATLEILARKDHYAKPVRFPKGKDTYLTYQMGKSIMILFLLILMVLIFLSHIIFASCDLCQCQTFCCCFPLHEVMKFDNKEPEIENPSKTATYNQPSDSHIHSMQTCQQPFPMHPFYHNPMKHVMLPPQSPYMHPAVMDLPQSPYMHPAVMDLPQSPYMHPAVMHNPPQYDHLLSRQVPNFSLPQQSLDSQRSRNYSSEDTPIKRNVKNLENSDTDISDIPYETGSDSFAESQASSKMEKDNRLPGKSFRNPKTKSKHSNSQLEVPTRQSTKPSVPNYYSQKSSASKSDIPKISIQNESGKSGNKGNKGKKKPGRKKKGKGRSFCDTLCS